MLLTFLVFAQMQETAVASRPAMEDDRDWGLRANSSTQTWWIKIKNELGTRVKITLEFPADQVKYFYDVCDAGATFSREINPRVAMNVGVTVIPEGYTGEVPNVSPEFEIMKAAMVWGGHVYTAATLGTSGTMVAGLQEAMKAFATKIATKAGTDLANKGLEEVMGTDPKLWPFKYFREVWPSDKPDAVTRLVWKDNEGMVLTGAHQQCNEDEEVFWGCCYRKCSVMSANKFPVRCGFNTCGKDAACNWVDTQTVGFGCAGFGEGFGVKMGAERCCRFPSAKVNP